MRCLMFFTAQHTGCDNLVFYAVSRCTYSAKTNAPEKCLDIKNLVV